MWDSFFIYALTPLLIHEVLYPKPTREERLIKGYEIRELFCRVRWLKATGLLETSQIIKLHYNKKSHDGF